jgi:hypothetical protein
MPTGVIVIAGALHLSALMAVVWVIRVVSADDMSLDRETRLYVLGALSLVAIIYEIVAIGVHRRKRWAWTASLVFLPLGVASVVSLGPSLIALLFLFNSRIHDWFDPEVAQRVQQ